MRWASSARCWALPAALWAWLLQRAAAAVRPLGQLAAPWGGAPPAASAAGGGPLAAGQAWAEPAHAAEISMPHAGQGAVIACVQEE